MEIFEIGNSLDLLDPPASTQQLPAGTRFALASELITENDMSVVRKRYTPRLYFAYTQLKPCSRQFEQVLES